MITETLFRFPHRLHLLPGDAGRGHPLYMFFLMFIAILTLLGTLIADLLYAVVDPRVRIA